jgi:hypothetical protein
LGATTNRDGERFSEGTARRTGEAVAWVVGGAVGVFLFGYLIAITLFILSYLKNQHRGWQESIAVALITVALIYGIFQYALDFELYEGIIYTTFIK